MKKNLISIVIIMLIFIVAFLIVSTRIICFHEYSLLTCTENETCIKCGKIKTFALGHSWQDATCTEPQFCNQCGMIEGSALGHKIVPATCTNESFCERCGIKFGIPLGHDYSSETEIMPAICSRCNIMRALPRPKNGIITNYNFNEGSTLRIDNTKGNSDSYIKLKKLDNSDVLSFYVQKGTSYTVKVPAKKMYVFFSYGDNWYGPKYAFGQEGHYAKDDEIEDFSIYEIEYTLYGVSYGNFRETPISFDSF